MAVRSPPQPPAPYDEAVFTPHGFFPAGPGGGRTNSGAIPNYGDGWAVWLLRHDDADPHRHPAVRPGRLSSWNSGPGEHLWNQPGGLFAAEHLQGGILGHGGHVLHCRAGQHQHAERHELVDAAADLRAGQWRGDDQRRDGGGASASAVPGVNGRHSVAGAERGRGRIRQSVQRGGVLSHHQPGFRGSIGECGHQHV